MKFTIDETKKQIANIKVIGVGGGGGNALNNMITQGLSDVSFIAANTDAQALSSSLAHSRMQLGSNSTKGLGAGGKPEVGREAAESDRAHIKELLENAQMVFVTAGMGGGTGTGAAPVIAEVARELGILTVGVVTKPFGFEGKRRMRYAEEGIAALTAAVDTLIIIPNEKLIAMAGQNTSLDDTFLQADEVLLQAVRGISDMITKPGLMNVDFADVTTVMRENQGLAMMGTGSARGEARAHEAAELAISSPLLADVDIHGAKGLLVNVTAAKGSLSMAEYHEAVSIVQGLVDEDAEVICGVVFDESMDEEIQVTVVATGLKDVRAAAPVAPVRNLLVPPAKIDIPAMGGAIPAPGFRSGNGQAQAQVATPESPYADLDIPTWVRHQAD